MVQIQGVGSLVNFPRWGLRFKPPTPPTFSSQEDSLDFKTNLPSHLVSILCHGTWRTYMTPTKDYVEV